MKLPLTFEQLKEKYPNPRSATSPRQPFGGEYCVGGAFCLMLDAVDNTGEVFPSCGIIGRILAEDYNIDPDESFLLASELTHKNDEEDFDGAWAVLEKIYKLVEQA